MKRVFANGPGERGSIPDRVTQETKKKNGTWCCLNTRHYKVRIKGKVEQSKGKSGALSYTEAL